MNVRPVRDFLLVQPERLEEMSKGGILIPKNAKAKHIIGKVLAVGPGRITDRGVRVEVDGVRVGDRVILSEHTMAQRVNRIGSDEGPMLVPEMDIEAVLS